MPQLDFAIYFSQVFWLFIVFYSLYYISLKYLLPTIAEILKVRQSKLELSTQGTDNLKSEESELLQNYNKLVTDSMAESRVILTDFIREGSDWLSKKTYELNNTNLAELNRDYFNSIITISARKQLIKKAIES